MKPVKTIRIIIIFLTLAMFSGCGIILPETLETDKAYDLCASLKYGSGDEVVLNLSRTAAGVWSGAISEPFALQGITVSYSAGETLLSRDSISVQPSDKGSTGAAILLDALESGLASGTEAVVRIIGSGIEISGTNRNGAFIIMLDRETTLPVSVTVAEHKLTAEFSGVAAKEFEAPILNDFDELADFGDFAD